MNCKQCKNVIEINHQHFDDLCVPCGTSTFKMMYGLYVLSNGEAGKPIEMDHIIEFMKDKTMDDLHKLVGEIKRSKLGNQ